MKSRDRLIRKGIHLLTGLLVLYLSFVVHKQVLLYLITGGTVFAFATFNYRRFALLHKTSGASLGTLFYPLGVLTAHALLYNMPIHYFQISLLTLTVSDTVANLSGQIRPGNQYFRAFREEKSLYGVLGFGISAFLIFWNLLPPSHLNFSAYVVLAILLSITFEVVSYKGSDNFSIPVGSALFFLIMERHEGSLFFLIAVILFSAGGAWLLYRISLLTRHAAVVVYFMGVYFFGVLGLSWTLPLLAFFLSSVILTRFHDRFRGKVRLASRRNAWQVLANGLWAILASAAYLVFREPMLIYLYVSLVAAVTADTWASETGPVFHRRCFSLAHGRMRASGVSGGISPAGSLAALAGALGVSILASVLFFGELRWLLVMATGLSGFLASFVDTLLGAFLEGHLDRMKVFGHEGMQEALTPNDLVNLLASLTAPLFFLAIWAFV